MAVNVNLYLISVNPSQGMFPSPVMENIKIIRITLKDAKRKNECGKKDFSDIVHGVEN